VVGFQGIQRFSIGTAELVAMSLLKIGAHTRVPRLFREVVFPAAVADGAWDPGRAMMRLVDAMAVPPIDRPGLIDRAHRLCRAALSETARSRLGVVTVGDEHYPPLLREIPDPPLALWVRGDRSRLFAGPCIAVVGSRNATPEGLVVARHLARGLSEAGVGVVSGLARGIDGAAHRGALEGPAPTIAVLGCGVDVLYPSGHRALADAVVGQGCLVSEYPPGTPPMPRHFPLRNRIISGLARAVVVVEASERSGSLITARMALEQGREVLAVPGLVASGCHRGCHALIKDGARLVETVRDILEEIGHAPAEGMPGACRNKTSSISWLQAVMSPGSPCDPEVLAVRTGRPVRELLAELGRLEASGSVTRLPGGKFVRLD
jgi:DNA processing protein